MSGGRLAFVLNAHGVGGRLCLGEGGPEADSTGAGVGKDGLAVLKQMEFVYRYLKNFEAMFEAECGPRQGRDGRAGQGRAGQGMVPSELA